MRKYKTISGDTWDIIAYKVYGDCKYIDKLMRANIEYLDMYIFPANVELNCPEINIEESTDTLPPWRK